jgi:hypothetical protein
VDEETSHIKNHIDTEREQLGRSLDELEYRVKDATNLKRYYERNTVWILGAAVAGGFLLSRTIGRSENPVDRPIRTTDEIDRHPTVQRKSSHLNRVSETLDDIFAGLVGVVSEKLHTFVADAVPGFREQYDAVERQRGRAVQPIKAAKF